MEQQPAKKARGPKSRGGKLAICLLITAVIGLIYFYVALPPINLQSGDFYTFIALLCVVYVLCSLVTSGMDLVRGGSGPKEFFRFIKARCLPVGILFLALIAVAVVGTLISLPIFRAGAYRDLLTVEDGNFAADITEISFNEIPTLDESSAEYLSDRQMGTLSDMVSQFEYSFDSTQINYQGRPVRVAPIAYADLIKWFTNRGNGLPAYVMVDMVTQEATVVRLEEGMKYSFSEPLNRNIERRIWQFPDHMFYMRDAIRLRYDLAPYIYNAAREAFDTGISMCRPMYYYWPEADEAYDMKEQYMFGNDLLVTAVAEPADKTTGLASRSVWFPEGKWYDFVSGELIDGDCVRTLHYTIAENPRYARAGAIIPMNPSSVQNLQDECRTLVLTFVPGADGELSLYEDDGKSKNYAEEFATTRIEKTTSGDRVKVVIHPRKGTYADAPSSRNYELRFPAQYPPVSVSVNGVEVDYARYLSGSGWTYDGYSLAPVVRTGDCDCAEECVVELVFKAGDMAAQPRLYGKQGVFNRCVVLTPEFKEIYAVDYDPYTMLPDEYMNVSQIPNFITEYPAEISKWLDLYEENIEKVIPSLEALGFLDKDFIARLKAQLTEK